MKQLKTLCSLLLAVSFCLGCFAACTPSVQDPEGKVRLAEDGRSPYRVVIAQDASEDIENIASEFVSYFEQITGVALPTVRDSEAEEAREILIGRTNRDADQAVDYEKMGEESLLNRVEGKKLILTGGSDRAVAYAVYGFFEKFCGVRYWSPDYEKVPTRSKLDIRADLDSKDEPVFWFRDMNEAGSADPKWMVKMRINSRQSLGSERFCKTPYVGGGVGYADWYVHTIGKLAEMDRQTEGTHTGTHMNLQPCLSDEKTFQTVLKNVRKWLTEYPDAKIVSISQNDGGANTMCACEDCSKLYYAYGQTQSGKWIWFVSKVANELKDEYPDVYFDTLAYNFTLEAPTNIEIPDNVIVRLAPAHACINHDYKTCHTLPNPSQPQKTSGEFFIAMNNWAKIAPHRFIWDYDALFYNYLSPFCNFDYIHKNIRNYADDGIDGVFMQGDSTGSNGFSELRAYLVAKCLWNPYLSDSAFQSMITEFMEGYYGKGTAEPLTEYIGFINERLDGKHFSLYGIMVTDWFIPFATVEGEDGVTRLDYTDMIDPMNEYFDRAEAVEGHTDEQKLHLRKARTQVKYYEVMASFSIQYRSETYEVDVERRRELNQSLYEDIKACGIQQISEGQVITDKPNFNYSPFYWDR